MDEKEYYLCLGVDIIFVTVFKNLSLSAHFDQGLQI